MLGGRGVECLVKNNDAILFVREILLTRRSPLLRGGVYLLIKLQLEFPLGQRDKVHKEISLARG